MKTKWLLMLFVLMFWNSNLNAIELRISERDLIETRQYQEDYLFSGQTLDFKGKARDLFFFCEQIDFSGSSDLALNGFARDINVNGSVSNGVKAAGRKIHINGVVKGTSFLAAEQVFFSETSQRMGDSFIGARKVTLLGKTTGNLYVGAAEISIQNEIQGDVTVYAGQLQIPEQGKIVGNLTYYSDHELSAEEASRVSGRIKFEKNEDGRFSKFFNQRIIHPSIWLSLLFKLSFIVFGLLILLFPLTKLLEKQTTRREILTHSLWGLLPMFVYPSAFVVAILLLITLPLAIAMLLAFMPILFLTKILGLTMIGSYLANRFNLNIRSRYLYFLLGVIPYTLLSLIPILGMLLLVFTSSIGCGLILAGLLNKKAAQ
ncbi:polymer-forming cytoskeletal protein [bacterium]|nr:polymer-forming cytoskeletal protein [bacterium]